MKMILAALLLTLFSFPSHAQTWPRNPKTGKVEFSGALRWPNTSATDSARQALAWDWYTGKLTTASRQYVERRNSEAVSPALLTYAGLPRVVGISEAGYYINCVAELASIDSRLYIHLYDFTISDAQRKQAAPIEKQLATSDKSKRAALAGLRKRLAVALVGW